VIQRWVFRTSLPASAGCVVEGMDLLFTRTESTGDEENPIWPSEQNDAAASIFRFYHSNSAAALIFRFGHLWAVDPCWAVGATMSFACRAMKLAAVCLLGALGICAVFILGLFGLAYLLHIPMSFCAWLVILVCLRSPCDQPLTAWLGVWLLSNWLEVQVVHGPRCRRLALRALTCWSGNPEADFLTLPMRVPVILASVGILRQLVFLWYGHIYLTHSVTCSQTSPWLFSFARWYWSLLVPVVVVNVGLMLAGSAGSVLLISMARRGLLDWSPIAARPDTIGKMAVVEYDEESYADPEEPQDLRPSGTCCICHEQYNRHSAIVRTPCGHYMHRHCLEPWLRVSRHCPVCRANVESACRIHRPSSLPKSLQ